MEVVISSSHTWRHQEFDRYYVLRSDIVNVKLELIVLVNLLNLTLFAVGHITQTKLLKI